MNMTHSTWAMRVTLVTLESISAMTETFGQELNE